MKETLQKYDLIMTEQKTQLSISKFSQFLTYLERLQYIMDTKMSMEDYNDEVGEIKRNLNNLRAMSNTNLLFIREKSKDSSFDVSCM